MVAIQRGLGWPLLALVACVSPDPCPPGSVSVESEDRCVVSSAVSVHEASDGGGPSPDGGQGDAAPPPSPCSADDLDAWTSFHTSEGIVSSITECVELGCDDSECPARECIREQTGALGCRECTESEGECVRVHCFSACGEPGNDRACLACACEAGCVARFEACARRSLGVCREDLHGEDLSAETLALSDPMLVRMKPDTGFLRACPVTELELPRSHCLNDQKSTGYGALASFTRQGRSYVVQHKNLCADVPCLARISPIASSGLLGHPVYSDVWSQGWDRMTTFVLGEDVYLARYKTGQISTSSEPKGQLRIDRLAFEGDDPERIELEPALDEQATLVNETGWSHVAALSLHGKPYLMTYGVARDGEVTFSLLRKQEGMLVREPRSAELRVPRGYDFMSAYRHGARWLVAFYASGRDPTSTIPAGQLTILEPSLGDDGNVELARVLFEGPWGAGFGHIYGYGSGEASTILRVTLETGEVSQLSFPPDPETWSQGGPLDTRSEVLWGTELPWRLVHILDPKAWSP